ncbi:porin family protein [Litorilituus lipolyticus]|uniref:Porin family protein n=1 Tax=Litorilituus lipolyticus TaxID=2491017 RepID=A0A502KVF3_9GAMM|nr:porin family protein [Litorilituus lipolyticus]TPH15084.1 porin family protein [Litorilituus lipolyticus]
MFTKTMLMKMALFCTLLCMSVDAFASYTKRENRWEASFQLVNSQSADVKGGNESSLDLDSEYGWGFTLGYNVNAHVLVNFDFSSVKPDYQAKLIEDDGDTFEIDHQMNIYQTQFNVVYHVLKEQFTPFVQAGLGWSFLDSNIADGPPGSICWWDPWWGYICDSYQNTHSDTRFSYNVAAGVRYELDNSMFFRASYKQSWVDLSSSEDLSLGMVSLEIGSIF